MRSRGIDEFGRLTGQGAQRPKRPSPMRLLGGAGNPQARNLFEVIRVLQEHEGVHADVRFKR